MGWKKLNYFFIVEVTCQSQHKVDTFSRNWVLELLFLIGYLKGSGFQN